MGLCLYILTGNGLWQMALTVKLVPILCKVIPNFGARLLKSRIVWIEQFTAQILQDQTRQQFSLWNNQIPIVPKSTKQGNKTK